MGNCFSQMKALTLLKKQKQKHTRTHAKNNNNKKQTNKTQGEDLENYEGE